MSCTREEGTPRRGFRTVWKVKPSLKFEVCNLIGILTGREIYKQYHAQLYREWQANLPAESKTALAAVDRIIGPNWPPGPRLSLLLSHLAIADSLSLLRAALEEDARMQAGLMASDYGSPRNWQQWLELKPHVQVVLKYLQSAQFEGYWRSRMLPELTGRIAQLRQELQAYDVVGDIERFLLDYHFRRDTVTVYLLAAAQPHELRLTSQSRYADVRSPVQPLLRGFYHEMLYPYCDRLADSTFTTEFAALQADAFMQECLRKFASNTGSNSFNEYVRKNLVIAAELWLAGRRQLIDSQNGGQYSDAGVAVRNYLQQKDGGAHALAAVVYSYLESGLKIERVSYAAFLKDLFATGRLKPGKIGPRYQEFINGLVGVRD
ncbi:hypothetical protein HUU05_17295 [candidate division KSB1 bacterium]|nr:hypothetical protein [candidate division KSB1 bacterium]